MKKLLALATAVVLAASLAACGGTKTTTVTRTLAPSSTTTSASTSVSTTTTQAATPAVSKTCSVPNVVNVTPNTVSVQLKASGYTPAQATLVNCATATTIVNIVAGQKAEMPVKTKNFACTPTVTGNKASFTCVNSGSTITYSFTLNYTG